MAPIRAGSNAIRHGVRLANFLSHVTRLLAAPLLLALAACLALGGCQSELRATGSAEGVGLERGTLAVRWAEAGRGLVHGEGRVESGAFWVALPDRPPPAAFEGGVALGELVLLPEGATVRLGTPLEGERGVDGEHALVYRDPELEAPSWAEAFPPGLSCARREVSTDGAAWALTPCEGLALRFADRAGLASRLPRD